jgi:hypothetical protein
MLFSNVPFYSGFELICRDIFLLGMRQRVDVLMCTRKGGVRLAINLQDGGQGVAE